MTIVFLLLFLGLLACGMPIFVVLGVAASVLFALSDQPLIGIAQTILDELNSGTLVALPLFVMAATFMRRGGIAEALVELASALIGDVRGALGLVAVISCTLFAAICGSSVATALAMGTILLPALLQRGYPRDFSLGVLGASGTIGIVIPPSLPLILYGIIAEQSVPRLFLAGIMPGLLQAALFAIWVMYFARKHNLPTEPSRSRAEIAKVVLHAAPALTVPAVVMVGIYGGFVTVSESAALAAFAALLVSLFVYRGFALSETFVVIAEAIKSASMVLVIVATAITLGHWVTEAGLPNALVNFTVANHFATWQFLLMINILLLLLGCFLEVVATLLVVMPILAPALKPLGVDPIHFGIIFTHNMEVALVHPPVGLNLYVLSGLSAAPIAEVTRGMIPFIILLLIVLAIITYVPTLSLWLPRLVYGG
jgi:C4-dicarboxylate transporter, DctM subunit